MANYTCATFDQPVKTGSQAGELITERLSVTASGTIATGDFLKFGKLPAGHRLVDWYIENEDFGTSCPVDIGELNAAGDDIVANTLLFSALELGTAGMTRRTVVHPSALTTSMTSDKVIAGKIGTVNTGASAKTAVLVLIYTPV